MLNHASSSSIPALLQAAMQEHLRGELTKAEAGYRHILNLDVMHPDANHNLGILALQTNQLTTAQHHLEMALLCNREQQQFAISYHNLLLHIDATAANTANTETANAASISDTRYQQLQNKRIIYLHQSRRFAELEAVCHFIIARHHQAEDAWVALGAALFEQGKPTLDICQKAVQLFPDNSAAHGNLGAAQAHAGLATEAILSAQRAITLKPNHAQAHYNLANCLKADWRYEEAEHHYRLAIANQPDLISAHHNLGLCLKAQGQFTEAQQELHHAVQALFKRLQTENFSPVRTDHQGTPRQLIHQERARQVLTKLCQQFAQAHIPCCLFAGTLLGVVRNGDILEYDKDLDLAIPAQIDRQRVIDAIASLAEFQIILSFGTAEEKQWRDSMSLFHAESCLSIDLFFLHEDGDAHFLTGAFHPHQSLLCRLPRFTFTPFVWRDQDWLIPNDPERYLEAVYGKQWRIPDSQFDTVISNPSRIRAAIPGALCYAYSHLFHALKTANWKRAYHLSLQASALQSDALLSELCTWIDTHHQGDTRKKRNESTQ